MTEPSQKLNISISPGNILMIFVFLLGAFVVYKTISLIISILVAIVLASFVQSIAVFFTRYKIPRVVSVVVVYILTFVIFGGLIYLLLPIFAIELSGIMSMLPEGTIKNTINVINGGGFQQILDSINNASTTKELFSGFQSTFTGISGGFFSVISQALGGAINFLIIVVISFYLAVSEDSIGKFLRAVSPVSAETKVINIWHRVEKKIGSWFRGQLLSATILALLTYIGLLLFNIPYAFILSLIVAVFGMIPFGILIATVPAVLIGVSTGGFMLGGAVLLLYILLQQIEEYLLHPLILNRATGVPSLVVLISLLFGAKLIGFMGLILALPIAMVIIELLEDKERRKLNILRNNIENTASKETKKENEKPQNIK